MQCWRTCNPWSDSNILGLQPPCRLVLISIIGASAEALLLTLCRAVIPVASPDPKSSHDTHRYRSCQEEREASYVAMRPSLRCILRTRGCEAWPSCWLACCAETAGTLQASCRCQITIVDSGIRSYVCLCCKYGTTTKEHVTRCC